MATIDRMWVVVAPAQRKQALMVAPLLEGMRRWNKIGEFRFENTAHNVERAAKFGIVVDQPDESHPSQEDQLFDLGGNTRPAFDPPTGFTRQDGTFKAFDKLEHQDRAFAQFKDLMGPSGVYVNALFAEMGTGKTKIQLDLINNHYCEDRIDAVLLVAKNGVHRQWVEDQDDEDGLTVPSPVKMFTQKTIPWIAQVWKGRELKPEMLSKGPELKYFCLNFEAVATDKAFKEIMRFVKAHAPRLMIIGDESHYWKGHASKRTKAARKIAASCCARGIMTGTPLAKDLTDEWSQLAVLDERILGERYVSTFRANYCVMGGFENRSVVGYKDLDRFKATTAPYVFRVKKADCLDLPEKQYRKVEFKLSQEQKIAIAYLKKTSTYTDPSGKEHFFKSVASALGKIQEVSNGFIRTPGGIFYFANPRLDALKDFLLDVEEKVIIWCRYTDDVRLICEAFGNSAVSYYGGVDDRQKGVNKAAFLDPEGPQYLVATTPAMAEGVDGLQQVCSMSIYYSNDFNAIKRWQSEDRIHRIGMGDKALYVDFLARGCVDYPLASSLKRKQSFSEMVLDITQAVGLEANYETKDWYEAFDREATADRQSHP